MSENLVPRPVKDESNNWRKARPIEQSFWTNERGLKARPVRKDEFIVMGTQQWHALWPYKSECLDIFNKQNKVSRAVWRARQILKNWTDLSTIKDGWEEIL